MYSFVGISLIFLAKLKESNPDIELEVDISLIGWIVLSAGLGSFSYLFHLLRKK